MTESPASEQHIVIQILRWLAVLPGSLVAAFLVMFPWHWLLELIFLMKDSDNAHFLTMFTMESVERAGYAFLTPLTVIYVGARIAPKFKFPTGIALAVLWGVGFGASILLAFQNGVYDGRLINFVITCALGIGGVAYGLHLAREKAAEREIAADLFD